MTDKALISDFTWRSLGMQKAAFPNMPHYVAPDEMTSLLRATTRKEPIKIHVLSLGVIAEDEKQFLAFMAKLPKDASVISSEEEVTISRRNALNVSVALWRVARSRGAAKIGARISADKKKASTAEAIEKIRDRWPLPSKEWPTRVLLAEADKSFKTVKSVLGVRSVAQYNYRAAQKRKERRNAR